MSMVEENINSEELEGTTVEFEDDNEESSSESVVVAPEETEETRTKVRNKSSGDDELESYSESVHCRLYPSAAADEQLLVSPGGSRDHIKKQKNKNTHDRAAPRSIHE